MIHSFQEKTVEQKINKEEATAPTMTTTTVTASNRPRTRTHTHTILVVVQCRHRYHPRGVIRYGYSHSNCGNVTPVFVIIIVVIVVDCIDNSIDGDDWFITSPSLSLSSPPKTTGTPYSSQQEISSNPVSASHEETTELPPRQDCLIL